MAVTQRRTPTHRATSVTELTLPWLQERGIEGLLLDVDNTLLAPREVALSDGVKVWLDALATARLPFGFVTNGRPGRVAVVARATGMPARPLAGKPLPFAFAREVKRLGIERSRIAMVGDQWWTDVIGGAAAGLQTVLVEPMEPSGGLAYGRLLRRLRP
jgi:HAD superfamily phosphatase (TIGR01668 family)